MVVEHDHASGDFYWNKHLLNRVPELKSFKYLLFLDNDVFANPAAEPLLKDWDSPLIGATFESTQAGWSPEYIDRYYDEYFVDRHAPVSNLQVINTGVLIIPREQSDFLESVYRRWKSRIARVPQPLPRRKDPFVLAADQPHVSYGLQAENRYVDFGERFNTIWWHWYRKDISPRHLPFSPPLEGCGHVTLPNTPAALARRISPGSVTFSSWTGRLRIPPRGRKQISALSRHGTPGAIPNNV